jgi:hypothetical protein
LLHLTAFHTLQNISKQPYETYKKDENFSF